MEHKSSLDVLLTSYLLQQASTEQEALVLKWVEASDANRQYLEVLKKTTKLISAGNAFDQINTEDEWAILSERISKKVKVAKVNLTTTEVVTETAVAGKRYRSKYAVYSLVASVAVAASFLLMAGFGWLSFPTSNPVEKSIVAEFLKQNDHFISALRHEVNNTGKFKKIGLGDGSIVELAGNSEISFLDPFPTDKRHITLKGKARFDVAKDKTRPFTIYSGDISTTALGTRFTVTAYDKSSIISVKLHEGKVVVKSVENAREKLKMPFFLLPGQELIYNNKSYTASIKMNNAAKPNVVRPDNLHVDNTVIDNIAIPLNNKGQWYMFNNQSLNQVFDQLQTMYDVEIVASKKDMQKLYFIGRFNKSDSLENVLNEIAKLTGLKVAKKDNKYIISRQ